MENLRKKGLTLLKFAISAALLYFIFTKIPFADVLGIVKKSDPLFLLLALVFFTLSKIIAALRLNLYFHKIDILLSSKSNLKLYLLGMFYNLFLPGGIGGDAYKGYYIRQTFDVKTKKVVSVLLLDRLSGLLLLFIFACLIGLFLEAPMLQPFKWLLVSAMMASIFIFWIFYKKVFSFVFPIFWHSNIYSCFVQLAQLGCVIFILMALHIEIAVPEYLFIFLISSIVAVLPLTIGGIGSREVVFLYGAMWLGLEENLSVSISMLFFLITAFVSLLGLVYHFKKPALILIP